MGFFGMTAPKTRAQMGVSTRAPSVDILHRQECKACPLNNAGCNSPKMEPLGHDRPLVYFLGAAPSSSADRKDEPFAGDDMSFLRRSLPKEAFADARFGNVIRTHPGKGEPIKTHDGELSTTREPAYIEIECCRPYVTRDIEDAMPVAIFGFGSVPLKWAANETHPYRWMGRRIPVKIGTHKCWYYPFPEIVNVLKDVKWDGHVAESMQTLAAYLKRAWEQVCDDNGDEPVIHDRAMIDKGVKWVFGPSEKDLRTIVDFLKRAEDEEVSGLDYETNALRPYNKNTKLLTAAVSIERETLAFPLEHRQAKWSPEQLDRIYAALEDYLYSKSIKAVHQAAFEMEWSAVFFGRKVLRGSPWACTLSQAYIINPTQGLLSLESLTVQHFGFNIKELSNVNRKDLDNEPLDRVLPYNALDAKYHRELFFVQEPILYDIEQMPQYQHNMETIPSIVLTQMHGIPIDGKVRDDFAKKYQEQCDNALLDMKECKAWRMYAKEYQAEFKPSSNPDVAKLLKMLGVKIAKSEKGNDITDEKHLRKVDNPIIVPLIKWKKAAKILSTYVAPISDDSPHVYDDGLIHMTISTTKVETWRTSSEDPNTQNWPKRGPNVVIRRAIGKRGKKVVAFDYAGIQARCIAVEARDKAFMDSFITGYDIHAEWTEWFAKKCKAWAYDDLLTNDKQFKNARSGVKNQFVFPSFFGSSAKSISPSLAGSGNIEMPIKIVEEAQEQLFSQFPDIKRWQEKLQRFYAKHQYVTGYSGHRRYAPIGYNQIINSPIQADERIIVLTAMNVLSELDYNLYQPMMEIHDDLTFLWPENEIDARADVVLTELTERRFDWIYPIPLEVEMLVGDNWCDLKEVGKFESKGDRGYIQK